MKRAKNIIHYWCDDTITSRFLGQGISVAVLDSGISFHRDLEGRVMGFQDLINRRRYAYDDNGHGTHIAGIIAGDGMESKGVYSGMAPKSNIYMMKILDYKGRGSIPFVLKGIAWLLEHGMESGIRIVNLSVGTIASGNKREEQLLMEGIDLLWDAGFIVVVAAGNYGPKSGTVTIPGSHKKVITVGTYDAGEEQESDGGVKRDYSGRGPTKECVCKPDVVAPGSQIISLDVPHSRKKYSYTSKSGTSMSTAIVSGAIAVLLSKYQDMTNVEVKLRLWNTSTDLGKGKNEQGFGQLHMEGC